MADNGHKFPSLQTIILRNNQITDEGLYESIQKLLIFSISKFVDLRDNKIKSNNGKLKKDIWMKTKFSMSHYDKKCKLRLDSCYEMMIMD